MTGLVNQSALHLRTAAGQEGFICLGEKAFVASPGNEKRRPTPNHSKILNGGARSKRQQRAERPFQRLAAVTKVERLIERNYRKSIEAVDPH